MEQNPVANSTLSLRSCTIFVPTNEAFQRHKGPTHVLYHISKYLGTLNHANYLIKMHSLPRSATAAFSKDQLEKTVSSDMNGNPPLYITKSRNGDIYVNNARIIPSLSVELTDREGKRQVSDESFN